MGTVSKDYSTLNAAGMVYLKSVKGCTRLNCFRSEGISIRKALNVTHMIANINSHRNIWRENLLRMDRLQISKIAFEYNPKGRRNVGRPRKRWAL
jgi:hypothetical protein